MPRVRELTGAHLEFWRERHLCTVTTLRRDGSPHVVPMGIVVDAERRHRLGHHLAHLAEGREPARRRRPAGRGLPGRRPPLVDDRGHSPRSATTRTSVAEAVRRYAERYRQPRENPDRVALRIAVTRVIGNV